MADSRIEEADPVDAGGVRLATGVVDVVAVAEVVPAMLLVLVIVSVGVIEVSVCVVIGIVDKVVAFLVDDCVATDV